jgi:hypothetical protein
MDESSSHPAIENAPPPVPAWAAGPEPPSPGLRRWLIIAAVLLVAAGAAVGVALAVSGGDGEPVAAQTASPSPSSSPTILAPTGVTEEVQPFSVTLSWTQPDGGVEVARYTVYRDGALVGSVDAPASSFTDEELTPGKSYTFEVAAVSGGLISDRVTVEVETAVPPLKAARVAGVFNVALKSTSQYGLEGSIGKLTLGWRFTPKCDSGPCNATVKVLNFKELKTTLKRNGAKYTGSDTGKFNVKCGSVVTDTTLTFTLNVKKAKGISGHWRATKLVGTLKQAGAAQLGCVASGATYSVTATLL